MCYAQEPSRTQFASRPTGPQKSVLGSEESFDLLSGTGGLSGSASSEFFGGTFDDASGAAATTGGTGLTPTPASDTPSPGPGDSGDPASPFDDAQFLPENTEGGRLQRIVAEGVAGTDYRFAQDALLGAVTGPAGIATLEGPREDPGFSSADITQPFLSVQDTEAGTTAVANIFAAAGLDAPTFDAQGRLQQPTTATGSIYTIESIVREGLRRTNDPQQQVFDSEGNPVGTPTRSKNSRPGSEFLVFDNTPRLFPGSSNTQKNAAEQIAEQNFRDREDAVFAAIGVDSLGGRGLERFEDEARFNLTDKFAEFDAAFAALKPKQQRKGHIIRGLELQKSQALAGEQTRLQTKRNDTFVNSLDSSFFSSELNDKNILRIDAIVRSGQHGLSGETGGLFGRLDIAKGKYKPPGKGALKQGAVNLRDISLESLGFEKGSYDQLEVQDQFRVDSAFIRSQDEFKRKALLQAYIVGGRTSDGRDHYLENLDRLDRHRRSNETTLYNQFTNRPITGKQRQKLAEAEAERRNEGDFRPITPIGTPAP